jgi:threonine dehydrogenase-like Zn-dependent dehydrogenase
MQGRAVFALHPHQTRFAIPASAAIVLPRDLPPNRAVLAANMETALNIAWDAQVAPGDTVAIVGAGVVGSLAGAICARIPGCVVTLIDVNEARRVIATKLGCAFALPGESPRDCDVVVHASATQDGLATALAAAGTEARVVEASWYGSQPVTINLGGSFHSRRLELVGSQVGQLPPGRRARWSHRRRLEMALHFLADHRLDALISGESRFGDLPRDYGQVLEDPDTLCHCVRYMS